MRRSFIFSSAAAGLLFAVPVAAQQATIDFSEYASPETTEYQATIGNAVTSKGIEVTQSSYYWGQNAYNALSTWGNEPGDPGNMNRPTNIGGATTLFGVSPSVSGVDFWGVGADPVLDNWVPFDFLSIDMAHLFHPGYLGLASLPAVSITFSGFGASGNFASQVFTIAAGLAAPTLQTFSLNWTNAYNVWFTVNSFNPDLGRAVQFTNIVTTFDDGATVPEPISIVLLATGLAGIAAARRRRRREGLAGDASLI